MPFFPRPTRRAAAALMVLGLAACANKPDAGLGGQANAGAGRLGAGGAAVPGSAADFAQNVGDRVFFETDSSELTGAATATLDKQAAWLTRYGRTSFTIAGHADERGTREYNFALGARRAETVKNYLAARGVAVARMRTTSFGKEQPVAVCDDISCWSQNRRAVTVLGNAGV